MKSKGHGTYLTRNAAIPTDELVTAGGVVGVCFCRLRASIEPGVSELLKPLNTSDPIVGKRRGLGRSHGRVGAMLASSAVAFRLLEYRVA